MSMSLSEGICEDSAAAPGALPSGRQQADADGAAAFVGLDDFCIGSRLLEMQKELIEAGKALCRENVEPAAARLVESALQHLERQVCRIAVIGQIKAGKSTFVNSLAQRPYILPTDVNPWTAVITKLHFGEPEGRTSGALFQFFSPGEWRRLVSGGRAGKSDERLSQPPQLDHLREGLGEIERRAVCRLGAGFTGHLGKHHLFNAVTPELVERYVAAGRSPGGGKPEAGRGPNGAGQFSDITRTADLFFDPRPFGYPSIVIDTPGANDPHRARDEITLQHLGAADIYVVVLTAQQPLSAADLDLLRILRGLRQERIVVLVNRIDGLADIVQDSRDIASYVEARLKREFPNCEIPVVRGSAWWSRCALSFVSAPPAAASPLTPEFFKYARDCGAMTATEIDAWNRGSLPPDAMARALYAASGVREIAAILSELMLKSSAARSVARTAQTLASVSAAAKIALKKETEARACLIQQVESGALPGVEQRGGRERRLERLKDAVQRLGDLLDDAELRFQAAKQEGLEDTRTALDGAISRAAAQETELRRTLAASGGRLENWSCDAVRVRRQAAEAFSQAFVGAAEKIAGVRDETARCLNALLLDAARGEAEAGSDPEAASFFQDGAPLQAPSLAPLSRTVALDRPPQGDAAAQLSQRSPEDNMRRVEELIKSGFQPVTRELVDALDERLDEEIVHFVRLWAAVAPQVVKALIQNETRLARAYERLEKEGARRLLPALQRVKDEQAAQLVRLSRIEALDLDLAALADKARSLANGGCAPVFEEQIAQRGSP
jgi:hypothetical protein